MKSCYLGDGRNPSSRKIIGLAKCNHKVTDLEKKRDYTSIKKCLVRAGTKFSKTNKQVKQKANSWQP